MAKGKYEYWLTPDGLLLLKAWARDGLTDEQIASNMGITAKTLYEWKKRYSDICKSLKKGKEVVDIEVENTEDIEGLIEAIIKANKNLVDSNNNNNWEMMGKDIKKLQELIATLEQVKEKEDKKKEELEKVNSNSIDSSNTVLGNETNSNNVMVNSNVKE